MSGNMSETMSENNENCNNWYVVVTKSQFWY